jgi:Zn-dependent protease
MHLQIQEAIVNVLLLWMLTAPHEFAHAWVATLLGDDTPRREGRVTLNPLAHVDWLTKLRGGLNGLALVAMAGPFSNIIFAVVLGAVAVAAIHVSPALAQFATRGVWLSLYLAIFNLLPVPPLDGSKLLLAARIPMSIYIELSRFGFMLLIVAVSVSDFGRWMSEWSYLGARAIITALR